MIEKYIKKYKIPPKRVSQTQKLYKITKDPKLSTYIINSTKKEPELIDYLIETYKKRSKQTKFKNPAAIITTMLKTIKINYISHKKKRGTEISLKSFEHLLQSGSVKIITTLNSIGEKLVFEVAKDEKGKVKFIYKDTIKKYNE